MFNHQKYFEILCIQKQIDLKEICGTGMSRLSVDGVQSYSYIQQDQAESILLRECPTRRYWGIKLTHKHDRRGFPTPPSSQIWWIYIKFNA
jgi:hypothetical protein